MMSWPSKFIWQKNFFFGFLLLFFLLIISYFLYLLMWFIISSLSIMSCLLYKSLLLSVLFFDINTLADVLIFFLHKHLLRFICSYLIALWCLYLWHFNVANVNIIHTLWILHSEWFAIINYNKMSISIEILFRLALIFVTVRT